VKSRGVTRSAKLACFLGVVLAGGTGLADVVIPEGPHVEIRGSLAMGSVARAVAEEYMGDHAEAVVTVSGGGTYRGLKSVIVGTADMAMGIDAVPEDLVELAERRHVLLESHAVFSDAVVVVVSPSNPLTNLSLRELREIFSGKLQRWADLGPERASKPRASVPGKGAGDAGPPSDEPDIEVVTFAGNLGPYETFKNQVLGSDYVITPRARVVDFRGFEEAISDHAIGYAGLHQVGRLKPLRIDGIAASAETVRSGRYPIARQLSMFVRKPASPTTNSLLEYFLAKDKGQRIAESLGNVPVK
jgi:phosphate transport system substrate-binding protein